MNNKHNIIIIEPSAIIRRGFGQILGSVKDFGEVEFYSDLESEIVDASDNHIVLINPIVFNSKIDSVLRLRQSFSNSRIVALVYSHVSHKVLMEFDAVIDIGESEDRIFEILSDTLKLPVKASYASSDELSEREKEILVELSAGYTNKEIGDRLNISAHTVMTHRKNIIRKTGINTVAGLTLYAHFNKLLAE